MQTTGFTIEIQGVEKYLKDFESLQQSYKDNLTTLKKLEQGTEKYYNQQKVVAELKNGIDDFNKALKDQSKLLKDVPTGSLKELNKEYKIQKELLDELEIGSEAYNEQLQVVGSLKNDIKAYNKSLKDQAKEFENIEKGISAYKELEQETRRLKNESKELAAQLLKLEKAGKQNTDEYKDLEKQYKKTTKEAQNFDEAIKEIDETVGDSFRNVGNYKGALKEAFFEGGGAVADFAVKLKVLAKNPLILVIGLLVGSLKLLFDAFKRSKTGTELLNKAAGITKGLMAVLTRTVENLAQRASKLGENIKYAFDNPKEALMNFAGLIKENIQNRIEGLVKTFGALGTVVKKIFSGDFKEASKAAGEAAKGFAMTVSGASEEAVNDMVEVVTETVAAYTELEAAQMNAVKSNAALQKEIESLTTAYEVQKQIAGDATLSLEENDKAALKAADIQEKLGQKQIQLAKNNLGLVQRQISLRRANGESVLDLMETEVSAFSELKAAQRDYTLTVADNATERREIKRDALERELDFLIDAFDKEKTINETLINGDSLNLKQKAELLKETERLALKSYKEQEAVIQSFTDAKVNLDELIIESDAKVINSKVKSLGVDDIVAGRILEIVKERKQAVQDLNDVELELNQKRIDSIIENAETEEEIAQQLNEIKYNQGLITQEKFNQNSLELELKRLNAELEQTGIKGDEKIKLINEITLKELEIKQAAIETELTDIDNKYKLQEDKENQRFLNGEITSIEHEERLKELAIEANDEKIEFLEEKGEENSELVQELLDEEVEQHKLKNQKILEDEQKAKEKRIAIASEISGRLRNISSALFATLINNAEGNETKQLELQRKQFQVNKAFTATSAAIDTFGAFNKSLKAYAESPLVFVIPPLILGQGLAQVAAIVSQAPPMAKGGFTGRGMNIDETGQRTTGLYRLHEGEYVSTKNMVSQNPKVFNAMERSRQTGQNLEMLLSNNLQSKRTFNQMPQSNNNGLLKAIASMTNNIQVVADSEEIVRLGNQKAELKKSKNL